MFLQKQHLALFAAFDVYPSAKGSATHIYHNAQTLFEQMNGGWLAVLGNEKLTPYQKEGNVEIIRFDEEIPNYLERGESFADYIHYLLKGQENLQITHFRDIWSGLPIIFHKKNTAKDYLTVYEINGLTSIELPYRYPKISPKTIKKIQEREVYCYKNTDFVITPSEVIKENLIQLGVKAEKITVITNGADTPQTFEKPKNIPEKYCIYFGALQPWQGINVLLKAMTYLQDLDLKLVICASNKEKQTKAFRKMTEKLGLTDMVIWKHQLSKKELYTWIHFAEFSLAPLTECRRNLEQGCCPLKVLESMALETLVIASDIPAVREIIKNESLGKLVRADRPPELARAMRVMLDYPEKVKEIAQRAKKHILENYTWEQKRQELALFYQKILKAKEAKKSVL